MGAELLMRTDGNTDMKKLTVDFRNFANAPKNEFGQPIHNMKHNPTNTTLHIRLPRQGTVQFKTCVIKHL